MSQDSPDADICQGIDSGTYVLAGETAGGVVTTLVHWHYQPSEREVVEMIHSAQGEYRRFVVMRPVSFHERPIEPSQRRH